MQLSVRSTLAAGCARDLMGAARRGEGKSKILRSVREPYAWLGVGALTLGMGAALAGSGVASADSTPSDGSASPSASARSAGSASQRDAIRPGRGRAAAVTTAAAAGSSATTSAARSTGMVLTRTRISAPPKAAGLVTTTAGGLAYATRPAAPLNPENFGPFLGALVRVAKEIQYVASDQKPTLNPGQLPSAPSQTLVAGTLGAYNPNGDPFAVAVTGQPTDGTVTIDQISGSYTYTPGLALAAAGGTDSFTITATNTAFHPLAAFLGIAPRSSTVTVPVTVTVPTIQPPTNAGTTAYYVTNTGYQTMQVAGYVTNQAALSPVIGTTIATGESVLFEIASGSSVQVAFNQIGVSYEGLVQTVAVGKGPNSVAVSQDGTKVYVANSGSNSVSVIDTASGFIAATIGVGSAPYGVAASPDGSSVYVANSSSNTVSVINVATNTVTGTIGGVGEQPEFLAVSPDGTRVYTGNYSSNSVSVIDTATNTVADTILVGAGPQGIAVSPDGTRAYVACTGSPAAAVLVIDTAKNRVIGKIAVGSSPVGVAVSPDGTRVYVAASRQTVEVIDTATNTVTSEIAIPGSDTSYAYPSGVTFSPDGNYVYVTGSGTNTVSVINAATNVITDTIAIPCDGCQFPLLGRGPTGLAVSSDGSRVYVADFAAASVSVLGGVTTGTIGDEGVAAYTVTMSGGSASCVAKSGACAEAGTTTYLEDAAGTIYYVPAEQAQQQSNVLQNLVYDDTSNATFFTKSSPSVGYTNPLIPNSFTPYINNTKSNSTNTYTVTTTTSEADSSTWNVSVQVAEEVKLGILTSKAQLGAQYTWGTTTTTTNTYRQSTTQTILPGETLYLYTETPVYRFYGDWKVLYGNTTYELTNVWYDTPYTYPSYPSYLAAYTCDTGSTQCAQLAAGDLSGYPDSFPTTLPVYPVAQSNEASSYNAASDTKLEAAPAGRSINLRSRNAG